MPRSMIMTRGRRTHPPASVDRNIRQGVGLANLVLGAWLFMSPFIFGITTSGQWHLYFWGAVMVILGGYQFSRATRGFGPLTGVSVGVALIGFWLAVSPLVYAYGIAAAWNNVIVGALLAFAGVYMTVEANRHTSRRTA